MKLFTTGKIGKMENKTITELKNTFTSYWHFLALQKACKLAIFDLLAENKYTLPSLAKQLNLHLPSLSHLVAFLVEENYLREENQYFLVTPKGQLLTDDHPDSLKNACIHWGEEHLLAWSQLEITLATGKPSFEHIYGQPFFDYLNQHTAKLENYHLAMRDYARDDYKNLPFIHDFAPYDTIADIGGGLGVLLSYIEKKEPNKRYILFDLPSVIQLAETQKISNAQLIAGDFFKPLHFKADVIILSRVLHDWNDDLAKKILHHCKAALNPKGHILVLEIMHDEVATHLLNLNMLAICNSHERTFEAYQKLLTQAGLNILSRKQLNNLQTILVCQ